jgi:outer membrane protein TolC
MQEKINNIILDKGKLYRGKCRRFNNPFLYISIYLYLFLALPSFSQSDSLMQYLEIASKKNPGVLQKYMEYRAALQKIPQAGSLPDPELTAGVLIQRMELMQGYQIGEVRFMQMFPWFGVLKNARDEMSLMAKAKFNSYLDAEAGLVYDVKRTWYEMNRINQYILTSENNEDLLRTIERLTIVRFKSPVSTGQGSSAEGSTSAQEGKASSSTSQGMSTMEAGATKTVVSNADQGAASMGGSAMEASRNGSGLTDLYRIKIELNDLANNIASLREQLVTTTARFNTYLNRSVNSPVALPDSLKADVFSPSIAILTDSILANNPMLGMISYEQKSLEARTKMVSAMGYPMVGLGVDYTIISKFSYANTAMNGKDMVMPMVTLTLPVYRKKYKAMKSEAEELRHANEQGYIAAANSLQSELYEAVQLFHDAERKQKLYEKQAELADETLRILLKSFSGSGANLTDLLRVRQQTLDYKFKQVEAVGDYNTSIAWLKKLGSLGMENSHPENIKSGK